MLTETHLFRRGKPIRVEKVGNYINGLDLLIVNRDKIPLRVSGIRVQYDLHEITEHSKLIRFQLYNPAAGEYTIIFSEKLATVMATYLAIHFRSRNAGVIRIEVW